jgi:hypothetical protein
MTDRLAGYIVTLAEDVRVDDAEDITKAIGMVKGVSSVKPIVADLQLHMAEDRIKHNYQMAMYDAVREVFEGKKPNERA